MRIKLIYQSCRDSLDINAGQNLLPSALFRNLAQMDWSGLPPRAPAVATVAGVPIGPEPVSLCEVPKFDRLGASIMAFRHPHGYEYDLSVTYSNRDLV